jgi:hypothetical protein
VRGRLIELGYIDGKGDVFVEGKEVWMWKEWRGRSLFFFGNLFCSFVCLKR